MRELQRSEGTGGVSERGEGPPIVFVHGVLVNGDLWRGSIDRLAAARGGGLECLGIARREQHAGALPRERARGRETDAAARPGDDARPPREPEVHAHMIAEAAVALVASRFPYSLYGKDAP